MAPWNGPNKRSTTAQKREGDIDLLRVCIHSSVVAARMALSSSLVTNVVTADPIDLTAARRAI